VGIYDIFLNNIPAFYKGLKVTLQLSVFSWVTGIILGVLLGVLSYKKFKLLKSSVIVVNFLLTSIPFLVILYWFHFPFQILLDIKIQPYFLALSLLTIYNVFGVAKIIDEALSNFPTSYIIAGKVSGLTDSNILYKIQIPIIFKSILPLLLSLQLNVLHLTLFTSMIQVGELFTVAQSISHNVQKTVEVYTILAIIFILICVPLNGFTYYLNNRLKNIN